MRSVTTRPRIPRVCNPPKATRRWPWCRLVMAKKNRFAGLTCYTCEESACGFEHAPPQSCFPKGKREHLIKVPSCKKHNQEKNLEDELLKATVVLSNNGSEDAMLVLESVIRAMENDPVKMAAFLPSPGLAKVNGRITGTFRINIPRFQRSIALIVRALWFHEYGEKLHSLLEVHWTRLTTPTLQPHPAAQPLSRIANTWSPSDFKGIYPEVFKYDFHKCDSDKTEKTFWVCRLCFYDNPPVLAWWN